MSLCFNRQGMHAHRRYWFCYRLIWKHWTEQLGKNEEIPQIVGQ